MLKCTIENINHNKITLKKKGVAKFHNEILKIKQVHPQVDLKSHLFSIVHENHDNIRKLIQRKRLKKIKKGSRQRKRQILSKEKHDESE